SRRRHTRWPRDWSSDVCSSDLEPGAATAGSLDAAESLAMPPKKQSIAKMAKPHASRPYMPGYGLPKGAKGLLPWSWAERLLNKSHNYWIATSRPDGTPHVMVVWALWL